MGNRSVQLVIFDNDGVLVDSETIACEAVAEALGERGLTVTAHEILDRYVGISASSMYRDIEAHYGLAVSTEDRDRINRFVDRRLAMSVPAMRGAAQAIERLSKRHALCVASSGTPVRIRGSLEHAGLLSFFEGRIYSATQVTHGKPAPDLFLFAAKSMGELPGNCLVVEDSLAGVTAAVAAGIGCVGFVGGNHLQAGHDQKLRAAGAIETFDNMEALADFIEGLS
jgi:HAD superfamily hydrolase (TIGR01509 family)